MYAAFTRTRIRADFDRINLNESLVHATIWMNYFMSMYMIFYIQILLLYPARMFQLAKLTSNHNYLHRLVSKQSMSSKYLYISHSVCSNAHTTPVRIYGEPYMHKFCAVDFFFLEYHSSSSNITRCQFHHGLGRGLMIQRVILIFIKCLSANQNQLFYLKV